MTVFFAFLGPVAHFAFDHTRIDTVAAWGEAFLRNLGD
jgi:hypothetical protein